MGLLDNFKKYFKEQEDDNTADLSQDLSDNIHNKENEQPALNEPEEDEIDFSELRLSEVSIEETLEQEEVSDVQRRWGLPPDKEEIFNQILQDVQNIKD